MEPQRLAPTYQVGGSLFSGAGSYVERACDRNLYQALNAGEFCYVLNSRQMGKSSLLIRTRDRLASQGYRCTTLDLTQLGTENITPTQWYRGAVTELNRGLGLMPFMELNHWWKANNELSLAQRLNLFIRDILLTSSSDKIIIFIDETDCILGLPFPVDDFFALIRYCYNQRSSEPSYRRLTFALAGVLSPADFIRDRQRTPFNIGTSIPLDGIAITSAHPLLQGLSTGLEQHWNSRLGTQVDGTATSPSLTSQTVEIEATAQALLERILYWTNGQPFLTQKLCSLTISCLSDLGGQDSQPTVQPWNQTANWIDQLVQQRILKHWETQDEPEHLRSIRDRLLGKRSLTPRLLSLYRQLLLNQPVVSDDSQEQQELFLSGLVQRTGDRLRIKNLIYAQIFNLSWVDRQLEMLRPYAQTFQAWVQSEQQDRSRLLQGNALQEAMAWSQGKSLSDLDYQYLSTSQDYDRQLTQQSLEAERTQAVEARLTEQQKRLQQEKQALQIQRRLLAGLSAALVIALALGATAFGQSRQARRDARRARLSELEALVASSRGALGAEQRLDALVAAIKAKTRLQALKEVDSDLTQSVEQVLGQATFGAVEQNQLPGSDGATMTIAYSPDGRQIATAGVGATVRFWSESGHLLSSLEGHESTVRSVTYSPDGSQVASAGDDKTIRLWSIDGEPLATLTGHEAGIWQVIYSADGQELLSSSADGTVRHWKHTGELLQTIRRPGASLTAIVLHPDGQRIAVSSASGQVLIWELSTGQLLQEVSIADAPLWSIASDPQGTMLLTGHSALRRLDWDGNLTTDPLGEHDAEMHAIRLSEDGQFVATASADRTVKLWDLQGRPLQTLTGHQTLIWDMALRRDGQGLASTDTNGLVRLWQLDNGLFQSIQAHPGSSWSTEILTNLSVGASGTAAVSGEQTPQGNSTDSPTQAIVATVGADRLLQLWTPGGEQLRQLDHKAPIWRVRGSSAHQHLATGTENGQLWLWDLQGNLLKQLTATNGKAFLGIDFSPAGAATQLIAGAGADTDLLLWTLDGEPFQQLEGHDSTIWDLAFGPQGQTVLTGSSDRRAKLWSINGKLLQTLEHEAPVFSVATDPQGELLATGGGDSQIKLWSSDGELKQALTEHTASVWGLAFTPDGERLLSASVDETVKIWNRQGELLQTFYGHGAAVRDLQIDPQGKLVSSMGQDGQVLVWDLEQVEQLELLDYACVWATDFLQTQPGLSDEERSLCPASQISNQAPASN